MITGGLQLSPWPAVLPNVAPCDDRNGYPMTIHGTPTSAKTTNASAQCPSQAMTTTPTADGMSGSPLSDRRERRKVARAVADWSDMTRAARF
jgi:hypothetical protein